MSFNVINALDSLPKEARDYLESNNCKLVDVSLSHLSEDELSVAVRGVDAAIAGGEKWTEKVFAGADKLKIVARSGSGYDAVDFHAAARRGIWVTNTPEAPSHAVADFALVLMLCLLRKIPTMAQNMKMGNWHPLCGKELGTCTVGVVGVGNIGMEIIKRVRGGFGAKVLGYDTVPKHTFAAQWQIEYVILEELLTKSDIVVLAIPANEQTRGLIDRRKLQTMKRNAYLVNIARPDVLVKQDLIAALKAGEIAGAAVDPHDPRPCAPDDPLVALDNVLATPWAAYFTEESVLRMRTEAAMEVVTVLNGNRPRFPVNNIQQS